MSALPLFNPAAVLGYAADGHLQSEGGLSIYRKGTGATYDGHVRFERDQMHADLVALGMPAKQLGLPDRYPGSVYMTKLTFDAVLRVCGVLARHGFPFRDPLFAEQVRVASLPAIPADVAKAYADFEALADGFFAMLPQTLRFLANRKPPANVAFPHRSRAVTSAQAGVYLTPDPDSTRFVRMTLRGGIAREEALFMRDAAHDYFERQGLCLDFAIASVI